MSAKLRYRTLGRRSAPPLVYILLALLLAGLLYLRFFKASPPIETPPRTVSLSFADEARESISQLTQGINAGLSALFEGDDGNQRRLSAPDNALLSPVALSFALKNPIAGKLTSGYGYRTHPRSGMLDFHTGVDIAAPEGTPISAALVGTVSEVGQSAVYGNYIILRHGSTFKTRYCHCSEIIAVEGQNVREGEYIAKVGSTGTVTGPHLHFETYVGQMLSDPMWLLEACEHGA